MIRSTGILLHISSLPGEYGEGAFGKEAKEFIDFLKESGFKYWQTLPFCMPDFFNSPYKSYSAFSGNPNFIDLPTLHNEGLITKEELDGERQSTPYACEFERLGQSRMKLLDSAAKRVFDTSLKFEALSQKIRAYALENPEVDFFCRFMEEKGEYSYDTWLFTQYEFCSQWLEIKKYANDNGIEIIGDIPIYVDSDSSDLKAHPEFFQVDHAGRPTKVAGVPPDYFCEDGQLWGNPLYDWESMKKDNYSWWRRRMEFMFKMFDGVRIDHFRAFESYFSIPGDAKTAKEGSWEKGPGKEFIDVLRQVADGRLLIAEDLGDIDDAVRELVDYSGFPGMRVLQFAFLGDHNSPHIPHNYIENTVAYTGTHDNNTLLGYVWELDAATRKNLLDYCGFSGENWDACYDTIIYTMMRSKAGLVIMPIQDLLHYGGDCRMNRPGLGEGNWSYRITKDQLDTIGRKELLYRNKLYGRI